jgi:hypothetical protein
MRVWPAAKAQQGNKLERLCPYISRPAVSEKRLSLTPNGNARYQLKTPYRESLPREGSECLGHGTAYVICGNECCLLLATLPFA